MAESLNTVCASCGGVNRVPQDKPAASAKCGRCGQPLFSTSSQAVGQGLFDRFVGRSDIPILVDFWAPWCGPCRTLGPILERAAARLSPGVRVVKVNIDEAAELAGRLGVQAVPTLAVFRNGRELGRTSGVMGEAQLAAWTQSQIG